MDYANKLTNLEELAALKEGVPTIATEGLISDMKDMITKNGKSYVIGTLSCRDVSIPIKKWDETLAGISLPSSKVVQVFGSIQIYEGKPQLIVTGFAESKSNPEAFINNALYDPHDMWSAVMNDLHAEAQKGTPEQAMRKDAVMAYVDFIWEAYHLASGRYQGCGRGNTPLMYFPYGEYYHEEKSGLLFHIYNVIGNISPIGLPKMKNENGEIVCAVDLFIVKAAVAIYRLFIFDYYTVDTETGSILEIDSKRKILEGHTHIFDLLRFAEGQMNLKEYNAEILNFKHCVLALNKLVEPATPEAILACNKVRSELELYKASSSSKNIKMSDLNLIRNENDVYMYAGSYYIN